MSYFKQIDFNPANQSAFGTLETAELTPIFQGDFIYGLNSQLWAQTYTFTVTDPTVDPTNGAVYTVNNGTFTVLYNSGTTLVCTGTSAPSASGTLTKSSGTGDATIAYSAYTTASGVVFGSGATVDTDSSRLRLQCGTNSAGYAYIQTRRPVRYRAGQGTNARFTPLFTAGAANNIQVWGMFSISSNTLYDGYGFGYNGTSFGIVHYIRGTPTWYTRASDWNGDKVDGSAGSTFTWDPTKGTPVMIKYPFLGYGDIFFYVQNPSSGAWILVHTIRYANTLATTQLANPSLRFTGFTLNSGNTTNKTMYCASVGMFVSGTRSYAGNPRWGMDSNKASITTENNIISIKNCTTYNGVTNRGLIRLSFLSFGSSAANGIAVIRFKSGVTLGGTPAFAAVNGTTSNNGDTITSGNSIASYDTAGTTVAGGVYIGGVSVDNPGSMAIDLERYDLFIGPGEILTISGFSTISSSIGVSLNWSEDI